MMMVKACRVYTVPVSGLKPNWIDTSAPPATASAAARPVVMR
jgi:hypothetical protein